MKSVLNLSLVLEFFLVVVLFFFESSKDIFDFDVNFVHVVQTVLVHDFDAIDPFPVPGR